MTTRSRLTTRRKDLDFPSLDYQHRRHGGFLRGYQMCAAVFGEVYVHHDVP
jgi:hypothetical protein